MPMFHNFAAALVSFLLVVCGLSYTLATFLPFIAVLLAGISFVGSAFLARMSGNPNQWKVDEDSFSLGASASLALAAGLIASLFFYSPDLMGFGILAAAVSVWQCWSAARKATFLPPPA